MENETLDNLIDIDDNTKLDRKILKQFFDKAHPDLAFATFEIEILSSPGTGVIRDLNIQYKAYSQGEFLGRFRGYSTIWYGTEQKLLETSSPERIDGDKKKFTEPFGLF
jgi:hypothetical protein